MRNVWAVTTRELRSYFLSPLAYIVMAFFLFGAGLLFGLIIEQSREASLRGLISNVSVLFLFVVPMISMRLLAEEQRTGTIVLGLTLLYPLFLFIFGNPDRGPIGAGYVGVILQAAAFLAVGLWASSLTENQIVAAVLAFIFLLVLWLSDNLGQSLGGTIGTIVSYTSVMNHFQDFPTGVINTKDVIYYLSMVVAGLVLSTLSLQSRRYR